ncbi:DUF2785 domain-containing protein [Limosilactobacillus caecicola]|uniref:DUF2785 domain-containing protein n=1 Tax=Limosilactobacillus caecicola TaxID=2941332 RepID=UPI0020401143|nr:DUF2785 domain-containing protein [Limosilactobacillus caecicola]
MNQDFIPVYHQLQTLHQQLTRGEIYLEAFQQVHQLIPFPEYDRQKATPVTINNLDNRQGAQIFDFVTSADTQKHPAFTDELANMIMDGHTSDDFTLRQLLTSCLQVACENNLISDEQLQQLYHYFSQPEVLLDHIDEPTNQAAFGRSEALALLTLTLVADRSGYFYLTREDLNQLVDVVALMAVFEKDTRAYVNGVGWVHLFDRLARLFSELCEHEELVRGDKIFLMTTLVESYRQSEGLLAMGENESIAQFLVKLFNQHEIYQNYFIAEINNWRDQFNDFDLFAKEKWFGLFNYRHLIQSLLLNGDLPKKVRQSVTLH